MKITENLFLYPEKGSHGCNTYVIKDTISVVIDLGMEMGLPELIQDMQRDGIEPEDIDIIANSHLHLDHCWANQSFKDISGAEIALHPVQKEHYQLNVIEITRLFSSFVV